jgi:hypothetical protein
MIHVHGLATNVTGWLQHQKHGSMPSLRVAVTTTLERSDPSIAMGVPR